MQGRATERLGVYHIGQASKAPDWQGKEWQTGIGMASHGVLRRETESPGKESKAAAKHGMDFLFACEINIFYF